MDDREIEEYFNYIIKRLERLDAIITRLGVQQDVIETEEQTDENIQEEKNEQSEIDSRLELNEK